jgi:ACR3 family arsenite efflux pump ArsB
VAVTAAVVATGTPVVEMAVMVAAVMVARRADGQNDA